MYMLPLALVYALSAPLQTTPAAAVGPVEVLAVGLNVGRWATKHRSSFQRWQGSSLEGVLVRAELRYASRLPRLRPLLGNED